MYLLFRRLVQVRPRLLRIRTVLCLVRNLMPTLLVVRLVGRRTPFWYHRSSPLLHVLLLVRLLSRPSLKSGRKVRPLRPFLHLDLPWRGVHLCRLVILVTLRRLPYRNLIVYLQVSDRLLTPTLLRYCLLLLLVSGALVYVLNGVGMRRT